MFSNIKKTKSLLQINPVECGAVCLSIVLKYFRINHNLNELNNSIGLSSAGCNALNLIETIKKYSLNAEAKKYLSNDVKKDSHMQILLFNNSHFVVYEGFYHKKYYINDPACGRYCLAESEFKKKYSNFSIIILNNLNNNFFKMLKNINIKNYINNIFLYLCGFLVGLLFCFISFTVSNLMFKSLISKHYLSLIFFIFIFFNYFLFLYFDKLNLLLSVKYYKKLLINIFNVKPDFFNNNPSYLVSSKIINDFFSFLQNKKHAIRTPIFTGIVFSLIFSFFVSNKNIFLSLLLILGFLLVILLVFKNKIQEFLREKEQFSSTISFALFNSLSFNKGWQQESNNQKSIRSLMKSEFLFLSINFNKIILYNFLRHMNSICFLFSVLLLSVVGFSEMHVGRIYISELMALLFSLPLLYFLLNYLLIYNNSDNNAGDLRLEYEGLKKENFSSLNLKIEKNKIYALITVSEREKIEFLTDLTNNKKYDFLYSLINNESSLINGSIIENICLATFEHNEQKIIKALELACINEIYFNRPMGLLTFIDKYGSTISHGQKKRLLLARSLFYNPELLLLDDFFDALHQEVVIKILENLKKIQITTIFTATREFELLQAHEIIFLHNNKVVQGTHEELLRSNKHYQGIFVKWTI